MSMFRRVRGPPWAGMNPNDRASPPLPHTTTVSQKLLLFSTTVYMQPGSLFISGRRPSCRQLVCSVYYLGLCLSITLPSSPSFTGRGLPGTNTWSPACRHLRWPLFTVPTEPFCCLSSSRKIKMIPQDVTRLVTCVRLQHLLLVACKSLCVYHDRRPFRWLHRW